MRGMECSMCRRPAAWLIDAEVFCEGHKELVIAAAGVESLQDSAAGAFRRVVPASGVIKNHFGGIVLCSKNLRRSCGIAHFCLP
jgi:hypothetical protein